MVRFDRRNSRPSTSTVGLSVFADSSDSAPATSEADALVTTATTLPGIARSTKPCRAGSEGRADPLSAALPGIYELVPMRAGLRVHFRE